MPLSLDAVTERRAALGQYVRWISTVDQAKLAQVMAPEHHASGDHHHVELGADDKLWRLAGHRTCARVTQGALRRLARRDRRGRCEPTSGSTSTDAMVGELTRHLGNRTTIGQSRIERGAWEKPPQYLATRL